MGQELQCRMHLGGRALEGKAYLETDFILFRGDERIKIPIRDLKGVKASAGMLELDYAGGPAAFELGAAAEKWAKKILHPPTLADKLGVKAGLSVRMVGEFDADFARELRDVEMVTGNAKVDLILFLAPARQALGRIPKLAGGLKPSGGPPPDSR